MQVKYVRSRQFDVATEHGPQTRVFEVGDIVELPELHARMEIMQGFAELEGEEPVEVVEDVPLNAPVIPNEGEQSDEQSEGEQSDEESEGEQSDEQSEGEQSTPEPEPRRRGRRS